MSDNKLDYIVIDFETANFDRYSAIQVGLVRFIGGEEKDSLESLIKPPTSFFIKEWTEKIHGLTLEDVKDAPCFDEVWENKVMPFINQTPNLPLVAHNAIFDMSVIRESCEFYGLDVPKIRYFDTLPLARKMWPELSHKLPDLGKHFNIKYKAHDALEDSRTCGLIVKIAAEEKKCTNIGQLLFSNNLCLKPIM